MNIYHLKKKNEKLNKIIVFSGGGATNSFKEFPTPERGTVTSAADKKSASLMAEALKMQKSREDYEPKRPPGAPSVTSD